MILLETLNWELLTIQIVTVQQTVNNIFQSFEITLLTAISIMHLFTIATIAINIIEKYISNTTIQFILYPNEVV